MGKALELTDGTALGILQAITTTPGCTAAHGGAITLLTSTGAHELAGLTVLFAARS